MSRKFLSSVCCSLFLLAASAVLLSAQVSKEANSGYQTKEQRERVASNLDRPEREKSQKPRELIAAIGVNNGDVIADIGSGVGFMLPYFLEAVGPGGKIYAEDIQQDFLDTVEEKKRENNWANVETILGDQKDPKLPSDQVDLAFVLDAFHHFSYPVETMRNIRRSLKPDGRLVMVDFYRSRHHPTRGEEWCEKHIRLDRDGFAAEIVSAGFKLERHFDHLPHQYVLVFRKDRP